MNIVQIPRCSPAWISGLQVPEPVATKLQGGMLKPCMEKPKRCRFSRKPGFRTGESNVGGNGFDVENGFSHFGCWGHPHSCYTIFIHHRIMSAMVQWSWFGRDLFCLGHHSCQVGRPSIPTAGGATSGTPNPTVATVVEELQWGTLSMDNPYE